MFLFDGLFKVTKYLNLFLVSNPCWSSECSHMCLISPVSGFRCACSYGFQLGKDGKTCISMYRFVCFRYKVLSKTLNYLANIEFVFEYIKIVWKNLM